MRSYDAARDWLAEICGLRVLEVSDNRDPLIGRKGGCTWIGDNALELMEPTVPGGPPDRFVQRFGTGMYGLALQVEDLRAAADWFDARGAGTVGRLESGYLFTRPGHTAGVHLEWAERAFADFDPRFGAPLPPPTGEPRVDVRRIAWWGAQVEDPPAAARRIAELCQAPLLLEDAAAPPDRPGAVLALPDGALALYRCADADAARALWGPVGARPRMLLMALRVPDLAKAAAALERDGVRLLRGGPEQGELVPRPEDTQGITLLFTDRDLPGDPRGPL